MWTEMGWREDVPTVFVNESGVKINQLQANQFRIIPPTNDALAGHSDHVEQLLEMSLGGGL